MNDVMALLDLEEEIRQRQKKRNAKLYAKRQKEKAEWNKTINKGVRSFWKFCQMKSPTYYTKDKQYLHKLCDTLQAVYEQRIIKQDNDWQIVATTEGMEGYDVCKKIMINMPPRHGKTRTLTHFCQWILGKNNSKKIITCSYNDKLAGDFSKYTRDGITEVRHTDDYYVFSDFFPNTKIKFGTSSYYQWALEGQYFNYLGAGLMGSITGKGGDILMIDDPIKSAKEAFNSDRLKSIWEWYTGTFLSRTDAVGGEAVEIITMTRWSDEDVCGRILASDEKDDWYIFKLQAYDEEKDKMLNKKVLSKKRYFDLRKKMVPEIFLANYQNITISQKGRLYQSFKTYEKLPKDSNGNLLFERIKNYTDTADEGNDNLCSVNYGVYNNEAYILDVLYTKAGMEVTEPMTAKFLVESDVKLARIESNNGGRGFARNVKRLINENNNKKERDFNYHIITITWFHQSKNKKSRIMTQSANVQNHVYFPINWKDRFPEFHKSMITYLKDGKNEHDDAQDAITGVVENLGNKVEILKYRG